MVNRIYFEISPIGPFGLFLEIQKVPNYIKIWSLRVHLIDNFIFYIYIIISLKYLFFNFFNQIIKKIPYFKIYRHLKKSQFVS